jgi:hypothetical protein
LKIVLAALALGAGAAIAAGCSAETASDFSGASPTAPLNDEGVGSGVLPPGSVDGGAAKVVPYRGNPLCSVRTAADCMPDDDGYHQTPGTMECVKRPPDAGDAAAAAEYQSGSCRIARLDGGIGPYCYSKAAVEGGDGATCEVGEDCAPGFDCVAGEKGAKTCRHYCCLGTCKGQASQNGGTTFCDVQSLVDVNQKAPVCMPLKQCKLLGTGECTVNETCSVVTESGDTGCVTIGEQQVGASCDEDHCAARLTCLGQPGIRKCYKLCKVGSADCGSLQVCTTSTVFKDPTYGTCQKPSP